MPLLFFFPFLTPALRALAALAPDRSLRRLRAARGHPADRVFAHARPSRRAGKGGARSGCQWALLFVQRPRGGCWLCA